MTDEGDSLFYGHSPAPSIDSEEARPCGGREMAKDIAKWLEGLGLGRFGDVFAKNEVDLDILPQLSDDDLKELGLPLGARRRLQLALDSLTGKDGTTAGTEIRSTLEPAASDQAERRQLTVMFCDLVGSTALSTKLDAEDLRGVLKGFQETTTAEVERYGGYVAKYMGDGVLAYFGYPEAHEHDAERAINAGLDIVAAVTAGRGNTGKVDSTSVRVGIATGFVVVGDLIGREASQERAVVGQTPFLAARLQGLAEPDTVIIDAATEELAGGLFELDFQGVHRLKGFANPRRAWAVAGRRRTESRFVASRRARLTELVGRDAELELLLRHWRRAQDGEGRLVMIAGEPGIGKSRLAHAALERIAGEPHTRLRYQCSPFHSSTALHPVIEQLECAASFESFDTGGARLDKLEALIGMAGRPVEPDAPLLADLLSIPTEDRYTLPNLSPGRRKQLVIETLAAHLAGLSERQPVLFVLEDAHWIDPTTQELLDVAIEQLPDLSVLMIVTHRPDFVATWAGRSQVTALTLNRLGRRDSAMLAAAVSGGLSLPEPVLEQIVVKTDGVPLFVEEFTRAVIESDATGTAIAIPTTLKDALEARLGRLQVDREVGQIGAAIGRTFDYRVLKAVYGQDEGRLRRALHELVEAQLLFVRGDPPEASYTFKHALVQDTAYDSLLLGRRADIHVRIAQVLETEFPGMAADEPEVLAHHLTQGKQVERAITYWQRAGEIAARRFAMVEAINHFTRAIELVRSLPVSKERKAQELALQIHLAPVYMSATAFGAPQAERAYRRALDIAKEIADPDNTFTAQWGLWMMSIMRPAKGAERRFVQELLELSDASRDPGQRLQACHASWTTNFYLGEFAAARSHAEEGVRIYDPGQHASHKFLFGGHDPGTCCRHFLAGAQFQEGHVDTAVATLEESLALAERLGHPLSLIATCNWFTMLRVFRREPDRAHDHIERSISLADEHGVPRAMWGDVYRGWILSEQGRPGEGLAVMQRTFEETGAVGQEPFRPFFLGLMAETCGLGDRPEEGLERVSNGLELAEQQERHWCEAELHRIRGELLRRLDRPAGEIEACFRHAIEIANGQNARAWHLRAATSLARFWASNGKTAEARNLLAPAYGWFTEGLDTADLKDAKAVLDGLR